MFQLVVGSGARVLSPNVQQEHASYEQQTHHKYRNRTPVHDGTDRDKLTDTKHTEAIQLLPVSLTSHNGPRTHSLFCLCFGTSTVYGTR